MSAFGMENVEASLFGPFSSAREGIADGGAGLVVTTGDIAHPTIIETLFERGAPLTCSFEDKRRAMRMALTWVEKHLVTENSVAVFTDRQAPLHGPNRRPTFS